MERRLAAILAADMVGYARLMEHDEEGVLLRQKSHRAELIDPEIARRRGRIVKTTGDGMLAEFASAQDAVNCAVAIQTGMTERENGQGADHRIQHRIGINLGDVMFDDGDIFGDGVNVAARLEGLAEPGGVCISDLVHQTLLDRIQVPFRDMGGQRVKNISRPIRVWQWTPDAPKRAPAPAPSLQQRVRYAKSADGCQIAYASVGEGPTVFKAPNWMSHLEYEWQRPIWGAVLAELAEHMRLVQFDQRGNGLSDWEPPTISADAMHADMTAVVEAAGLARFALLGVSQGCAFSVRYAVEHPERVSCLVLLGGFLSSRKLGDDPEIRQSYKTSMTMIRDGWGSPNPTYRNFFTMNYIPSSTPEQVASFDELQRMSTNTGNALKILDMNGRLDMLDLARRIEVPTLVLHCRGDRVIPIAEGLRTARAIPGASFVELPGDNHVILEGAPAFDQFFEAALPFLKEHADA